MRAPRYSASKCLWAIVLACPLLVLTTKAHGAPIITIAPDASEKEIIAARELARYAQAITAKPLTIRRAASAGELPGGPVFVITIADHALGQQLASQIPTLPDNYEGFSIGPFRSGKKRGLLILARSPVGCLYGVYHYLDHACGVGFFEDGDHIPRLSSLPVEAVQFQEAPRFPERMAISWMGWRTLKKNRSGLWDFEDWRGYIDWCVKNKYNMIRMDLMWWGAGIALGIYEEIIPGFKLDDSERAAFAPMWPSDYARELYRKVMRYGRSRGIRFVYLWNPAEFPTSSADAIARTYPQAQLSRPDPNYLFLVFLLDRPSVEDFFRKFVRRAIEVFGTDHLYYTLFPSEQSFLGEYIPDFRPYYTNLMGDIILEVDPQARFYLDGWGIALAYQSARQLTEEYFDHLTHPSTVLSTYPYFRVFRDRFDYYMGWPWHYVEVDAFGHEDYWHTYTPYAELIERAKEVLTHPGSNCVGFSTLPEIINYDPFYRTLLAKLGWDPWDVGSLEDFIGNFVRHRYSPRPGDERGLTKAWSLIAEAISDNRLHVDPYIPGYTPVYRNTALNLFPPVQMWPELYVKPEDVQKLEKALGWLLRSLPAQQGNPLYQHDLADLFHLYASETYKFELIRLHAAYFRATELFQAGATDGPQVEEVLADFERGAEKMDDLLSMIQQVWETRPELSIERDIEEAMSVPGAHPLLARNIRGQVRVFQNGSVEVMAACYRPEIQAVIDNLRQRLVHRETELFPADAVISYFSKPPQDSWGYPWLQVKDPQLASRLSEIHERFVSGRYSRPPVRAENTASAVARCFRRMGCKGLTARSLSR